MEQVGLVFDAGIEEELLMRHLQVVDATRASLGLPIVGYTVTDTPLLVCFLSFKLNFRMLNVMHSNLS